LTGLPFAVTVIVAEPVPLPLVPEINVEGRESVNDALLRLQ
jgi:hypothetical protein